MKIECNSSLSVSVASGATTSLLVALAASRFSKIRHPLALASGLGVGYLVKQLKLAPNVKERQGNTNDDPLPPTHFTLPKMRDEALSPPWGQKILEGVKKAINEGDNSGLFLQEAAFSGSEEAVRWIVETAVSTQRFDLIDQAFRGPLPKWSGRDLPTDGTALKALLNRKPPPNCKPFGNINKFLDIVHSLRYQPLENISIEALPGYENTLERVKYLLSIQHDERQKQEELLQNQKRKLREQQRKQEEQLLSSLTEEFQLSSEKIQNCLNALGKKVDTFQEKDLDQEINFESPSKAKALLTLHLGKADQYLLSLENLHHQELALLGEVDLFFDIMEVGLRKKLIVKDHKQSLELLQQEVKGKRQDAKKKNEDAPLIYYNQIFHILSAVILLLDQPEFQLKPYAAQFDPTFEVCSVLETQLQVAQDGRFCLDKQEIERLRTAVKG
ncbi:MAG: hypothetical protein JSR80_04025 [Verrucomicrobia bacterium]|nr:hypothetical protein [Verrucomicrobiota bacterium]